MASRVGGNAFFRSTKNLMEITSGTQRARSDVECWADQLAICHFG
jgi:hypothetical protein